MPELRQKFAMVVATVLVISAVAYTAANVHHEFFPSDAALTQPLDSVSDWRSYAVEGAHQGPRTAPVKLVVFSDYECGVCRVLAQKAMVLRAEFPDELEVVWRHFPLAGHMASRAAAVAAWCAAEQGGFDRYPYLLFARQGELLQGRWGSYATEVGIRDSAEFAHCIEATEYAPALERDIAAGKELRVVSTPTILVNGDKFRGLPPDFDRLIYRAVRRSRDHR